MGANRELCDQRCKWPWGAEAILHKAGHIYSNAHHVKESSPKSVNTDAAHPFYSRDAIGIGLTLGQCRHSQNKTTQEGPT